MHIHMYMYQGCTFSYVIHLFNQAVLIENQDTSLIKTLLPGPKMSTLYRFYCIHFQFATPYDEVVTL